MVNKLLIDFILKSELRSSDSFFYLCVAAYTIKQNHVLTGLLMLNLSFDLRFATGCYLCFKPFLPVFIFFKKNLQLIRWKNFSFSLCSFFPPLNF